MKDFQYKNEEPKSEGFLTSLASGVAMLLLCIAFCGLILLIKAG